MAPLMPQIWLHIFATVFEEHVAFPSIATADSLIHKTRIPPALNVFGYRARTITHVIFAHMNVSARAPRSSGHARACRIRQDLTNFSPSGATFFPPHPDCPEPVTTRPTCPSPSRKRNLATDTLDPASIALADTSWANE